MRLLSCVSAITLALVGCRSEGDDAPETPDGGTQPDAPDGVGCSARAARARPLEAFVGPTGLESRMIAAIDGADASLDVQMYLFTVDSIRDRIIAAKQRGVAVRVILDPDTPGNDQIRPGLLSAGVPTRDATPAYEFAHAKYMIVDGATAYIMSMNWNYDALSKERNYGIVDTDPEDVADLRAIFEMDWAAAGGETPRPADLTCTRLIVSPNNARMRILEHINAAKETLDIEVLYLSETTIRNAVGMAKQRGVAVRVLTETPDSQPDDTTTYLHNVGVPIKYASSFLLHAKLIVSDGLAFVGSENMSVTSLTKNREVGAIVLEPVQNAKIQAQFEMDWVNSPDAP